jgi:hypothetical protein|uniref:Uncharacterized protein n=1 Tax=Oryza rufipogon TaxID=4529 RepID=A0A0E0PQG6_ORYRU
MAGGCAQWLEDASSGGIGGSVVIARGWRGAGDCVMQRLGGATVGSARSLVGIQRFIASPGRSEPLDEMDG